MTDDSLNLLELELERRIEEKAAEERILADTRALLERVDEQRRKHPEDQRRWNRRADALEDALLEARRRVGRIEQTVNELGKRIDGLRNADRASLSYVEQLPPEEPDTLADQRRQAAGRILGAPVFQIEQVPLEEFALAKAYLDSVDSRHMARNQREELARRIGIYDRRAERERMAARPRITPDERRQQHLLRQIIEKCQSGAFAGLTLGEIDVLIHSYELLAQRAADPNERDRLLDVVNRAVDEVCDRWANLDRLRAALSSRR